MNRIYMGQIMAECDCSRQEACEAAQKCLAEKPQPVTPEEVFMGAVWDALKTDTSDLGKQARILAAFRVAIDPAAIREAALREAAELVRSTSYTSSGDKRSLEPVSAGLKGMDMHHATIADSILALIGETK